MLFGRAFGTRLRNWTATRARAALLAHRPAWREVPRDPGVLRDVDTRRRSADYFPAFRITNFGFAATCSTPRNSRLSLAW